MGVFENQTQIYLSLGQKKLMNSFSGQISKILMRQAGNFFLFFFLVVVENFIAVNRGYFLVYLLPYVLIKQIQKYI